MNLQKLINKKITEEKSEIHTALPAKIEEYNHKKMKAKITLLAKKELQGEKYTIPPILEVPVAHQKFGNIIVRPGFSKGDKVQVLFNERALDKIMLTGEPEDAEYSRTHSLDDAVVLSGLKIEQDEDYPDKEKESLYISNLENNVDIIFKQNGTFKIADNENGTELIINTDNGNIIQTLANNLLIGDDTADDAAVLLSKLQSLVDELQSHTHPSNGSPPTQTFTTDLGSEEVFLRQ